ncbi:polymorphic toxin type 15 domain-containing protein [Aquabacterium sp.]|uniref:polymorphic toxin type 15 domain-containing protein n=1 Tax=Aquabacterium sp. TaxID=1872578 RepID=UPI002CDC0CE2|nr:polymorphic toxin type 15 domain-containing protein [Aquabacterium sp.]HSW04162.1 polymorphic toxin type 15 domain-containing protein [Aquabacterium sp.]
MPEPAQQSFWDAGVSLSQYIGEPTAPRRLDYDLSKPPPGAAWYEKLLFYAVQGQYNQAVSQSQQAEAMADGAKWLWGALQGDFNKNPTTGQVIVGGIISMIPLVDQACDVRDVIANCVTLSDEEARKDNENWIALGLTCIGFVPEFGSAIKTVAKVAVKKGTVLLDLLKQMEWIERHFERLKAGCPWTRAPIDWLRKFDWQKAAQDAAAYAKRAFASAQAKAAAAAKYAIGAIKTRQEQLAALFKQIVDRIAAVLSEVAQRIKARIDEMLKTEKKEAGNYGASPGGQPNRHLQEEAEPPREPPRRPPGTAPHRVPCFHPYDKKKFQRMNPEEQKAYLKEMAKQLKRQEDEINGMTTAQYKAARDAFATRGRNPMAEGAQAQFRRDFEDDLQESIANSIRLGSPTMGPGEVEAEAKRQSKDLMKKLAALHEPDMVAGGWMQPDPKAMGRADVNSSIGGSWNQEGRVAGMDAAADDAIRNGRGSQPMNVSLEVCRGNGLR